MHTLLYICSSSNLQATRAFALHCTQLAMFTIELEYCRQGPRDTNRVAASGAGSTNRCLGFWIGHVVCAKSSVARALRLCISLAILWGPCIGSSLDLRLGAGRPLSVLSNICTHAHYIHTADIHCLHLTKCCCFSTAGATRNSLSDFHRLVVIHNISVVRLVTEC